MPEKEHSPWFLLRICFVIGILSLWLLLELKIEKTDLTLFVPHTQTDSHLKGISTSNSGFLVNTNGCRIPDLNPMDPAIQKYITQGEPLKCEKLYGPALVESSLTSIFINESVLSHYNVTDINELFCCYTPFWRVEMEKVASGQYPSNVDNKVKRAETCTHFDNETVIDEEFVKVECFLNNNSIYVDYYAFPLLRTKTKQQHNKDAVSVLIFGVDAVSRLNFYRQMPITLKFLKKQLNAVEMFGYNKVEDNTFPNLVPVLNGLSVDELKASCWPTETSVFDECNFVWKNFSAAGYKTAFAEDASWMGIFSYVKRGFRKQPTDYYMRVFNKEAEDNIGFEKRLNAKLCVGPRKTLDTLINYAYKFEHSMKEVLSFGLFWGASLSHDFLNLPRYSDEDHTQFLENLLNEGIFNKTVLIFMSDHGIRWGGIRSTYQGFLEERLPFLFIAYPDWFRIKYTTAVSNLKKNSNKLTTPFDLHELLIDLTDLTKLDKDILRIRTEELENAKTIPRGISLFLPIPGNRTCSDAGIIDHWCTCHKSVSISTNDTQVKRAVAYLVKHINSLLSEYPKCAQLKLNRIINARVEISISHNTFKMSDAGIKDFSLTIETIPGRGQFEATVRHDGNTNSFVVVGTISRINLYGEQSKCIPYYKLRLYCYCIHD